MMDLSTDKYILSVFRNKGFKCTPQRIAVLKTIEDSETHLSVEKIHNKVNSYLPNIGLATIYRSLDSLVSMGLIERVHTDDGCHSYVSALNGHRHAIVCKVCDRILDYEDCPLENIVEQVSKKTGFLIDNHHLQLFGTCKECQSTEIRD